jgi:uncharacterized protein YkwD
MARRKNRLKHFFVAHKGNKYRPGIFAKEAAIGLLAALILVEGAYQVQVHFVLQQQGFLATVLPAALATLANQDRQSEGLTALIEDPELDAIAQAKADDMAQNGYFAHVSPDGKTPWYWLQQAGYPYTYAGENLAVDFTDSADVEDAWMKSPAHRANILKQQYTRVGIAVAQGMYEGKEVTFVAQFFATRKDDANAAPAAAADTKPAEVTPATEPAETVAAAPETPSEQVLGAANESPSPSPVAVAVTSPGRVVWYVFGGVAALLAFLLAAALIVHARRKEIYVEVLGTGLLLTGVAAALMLYSGAPQQVTLPTDGQSASVLRAL